jgi:hypothetical protein
MNAGAMRARCAALLRRGGRASVSVELALVSAFFLVPLILVAGDGLSVLAARSQTYVALRTLYYLAWSTPSAATQTDYIDTLLAAYDNGTVWSIARAPDAPPALSYGCLQSDGSTISATAQTAADGSTTETCSAGTLETDVSYTLRTAVTLPFPLPFVASPVIMEIGGTVRDQ